MARAAATILLASGVSAMACWLGFDKDCRNPIYYGGEMCWLLDETDTFPWVTRAYGTWAYTSYYGDQKKHCTYLCPTHSAQDFFTGAYPTGNRVYLHRKVGKAQGTADQYGAERRHKRESVSIARADRRSAPRTGQGEGCVRPAHLPDGLRFRPTRAVCV